MAEVQISDPLITLVVRDNFRSRGLLAHPVYSDLMVFYTTPLFKVTTAGSPLPFSGPWKLWGMPLPLHLSLEHATKKPLPNLITFYKRHHLLLFFVLLELLRDRSIPSLPLGAGLD